MKRLSLFLIAYNALYLLLSPFIIIYLLFRKDSRQHWKDYLGLSQTRKPETNSDQKFILIHGVSVGEVLSAIPLIKQIRAKTKCEIVLSTTIEDAIRISEPYGALFHSRVFLPLDFYWFMNRFIRKTSPEAVIISETDFWPNMLHICRMRRIPVYLVNGRISQGIASGATFTAPVSTILMSSLREFFVQREIDKTRLIDIGVPSEKITVSGNAKYEAALEQEEPPEELNSFMSDLKSSTFKYITGGSTHPGEEDILFRLLKKAGPGFKLIIAPRNINRSAHIHNEASSQNFNPVLYSEFIDKYNSQQVLSGTAHSGDKDNLKDQNSIVNPENDWDILIIDSLGVLKFIYTVADLVFIGGTFSNIGGHNFLEAAVHKKAIIAGPDLHNFSEDKALFIEEAALVQFSTAEALIEQSIEIIESEKGKTMGRRAFDLLMKNQGTSQRTAENILNDLKSLNYVLETESVND